MMYPVKRNYPELNTNSREYWIENPKTSIQKEEIMSRLIKAMKTKDTYTENAMPTHSTSSDACLDWFAGVGSARNWSEDQIVNAFVRALETDPLIAMRTLFWARDARQGAGERRVFRICIRFLEQSFRDEYVNYLFKNLHLIPEYGRWDDLFELNDERVLDFIEEGLEAGDGLLAKWLPRKGPFAARVRNHLGLSPKQYRKLIVGLSNTVEQRMCARDWDDIVYEHVPSVAMHKYRKAFARNDNPRYTQYVQAVLKGETEMKAGVLFPYQLYQAYKKRQDEASVTAQWNSLPNFMEGNEHRVLPMCDVSGSMACGYGSNTSLVPMDISVSLGIYISERNEGLFKDAFMTFSGKPTLQYLKGSFYKRCHQLERAHWEMNTNIEAAFAFLLKAAKRENVSHDEMPDTILIISDMQFDRCVREPGNSAMQMFRRQYREAGYELPTIVFWQVNARAGQVPVKFNERGTAIVSGCSPTILKSVLDGTILDPRSTMLKTVMSERYEAITV